MKQLKKKTTKPPTTLLHCALYLDQIFSLISRSNLIYALTFRLSNLGLLSLRAVSSNMTEGSIADLRQAYCRNQWLCRNERLPRREVHWLSPVWSVDKFTSRAGHPQLRIARGGCCSLSLGQRWGTGEGGDGREGGQGDARRRREENQGDTWFLGYRFMGFVSSAAREMASFLLASIFNFIFLSAFSKKIRISHAKIMEIERRKETLSAGGQSNDAVIAWPQYCCTLDISMYNICPI